MLKKLSNNKRYYTSYIVSFLLISSILSNVFTLLLTNVVSDFRDISIVASSFIISFILIKKYYKPLVVLK